MKIDFKWNKSPSAIANDVAGKEAQLFMANEAKRLMDPYVPAQNMGLSRLVQTSVENGRGIVHYQSSYARYQYEGKVMVSKRPGIKGSSKIVKQPIKELTYSRFRHPLATSEWDKAMLVASREELVRAMQNFVDGRSR